MTAEWDLAGWVRADRARLAREAEAKDQHDHVLPPIEQRAAAVEVADLPGGAKRFAKAAAKAGFEVRATMSRGPYTNVDGTFNRVADCALVRTLHADGRRAVATWVTKADGGWATEVAYVGEPDVKPTRCKVTEASEFLGRTQDG